MLHFDTMSIYRVNGRGYNNQMDMDEKNIGLLQLYL